MGRDRVDGTPCHHIALTRSDIDWQLWIEDSERKLPRKLTITYKSLPGSPQYTAILSDWNFTPAVNERSFVFHPPEGADRIEFIPAGDGGTQTGGQGK